MNAEVRQWIESKKPQMVDWAEDFVRVSQPHHAQQRAKPGSNVKARVSTSQFRVLLSAAQAGSGLKVLSNLLRYQLGRGRTGWKDKTSGEALLALLREKLAPLCQQAAELGSGFSSTHRLELEAHLAAQLLGFILREHTYGCAVEGTKH